VIATALLIVLAAFAVSVAIIPVLDALAPRLRLMDEPDTRKVHDRPVSCIGGFGIFAGSLLAVLVTLPMDRLLQAYVLGALVVFAFGIWDDRHALGHYAKFTGQTIAVLIVVLWGDLSIHRVPFMGGEALPPELAIPFTVFAMVGMINATNHSDGLDGLAGGQSLLSLLVIAFLAYTAGGLGAAVVALAALGGVLGFLPYNMHPARVFMGDNGSQFLGYTLGFLVVLLTQHVNPALSPAVAALLLGLPVIDILAVFAMRVHSRINWFKGTQNHLHHRLLDLGFNQNQAVVILYSVQGIFVISAIFLADAPDALILGLYLTACALVFAGIMRAERRGRRTRAVTEDGT